MIHNHERQWHSIPYRELKRPKHNNFCQHKPENHVGTIEYFENIPGRSIKRVVDVYMFNQYNGQYMCLRTGDEPGDYCTPGTVLDLIIAAQRPYSADCPLNHLYIVVAEFIDKNFLVTYTPKKA